jgi:MYXO-CTERM domain-containing protein
MNSNWLSQLAPDHAPAPPNVWPPAPGWWALALLTLAAIVLLRRWWKDPQRRARRAALSELQRIRASDGDGAAVARAIQNLLRRYALTVFGRQTIARLTGEAWLQFVAAEGGEALAGHVGRSMLNTAFGNHSTDERDQWAVGAEGFIKRAARKRRRRGR